MFQKLVSLCGWVSMVFASFIVALVAVAGLLPIGYVLYKCFSFIM